MKLSYRGICYDYEPVKGEIRGQEMRVQYGIGGTPLKIGQETQQPDIPVLLKYRGISYTGFC